MSTSKKKSTTKSVAKKSVKKVSAKKSVKQSKATKSVKKSNKTSTSKQAKKKPEATKVKAKEDIPVIEIEHDAESLKEINKSKKDLFEKQWYQKKKDKSDKKVEESFSEKMQQIRYVRKRRGKKK